MTKRQSKRLENLLPNGIPRWIRVYDNEGASFDRYTVVFTGRYNNIGRKRGEPLDSSHFYVGMSGSPYHPQGFCQRGSTEYKCCDVGDNDWPPAIGRRNHLGKRISFNDLPDDCKKVTIDDYKDLWKIE